MSDERVVTTVVLEGDEAVIAGFEAIGDAAARGFSEVDRAASASLVGLARVERSAVQFGDSLRNVGGAAQNFATRLRSIASTATRYTAVITAVVLASQRLAAAQDQNADNSKEQIAQARLESQAFGDRLQRTLENERALKDLNGQLASGAITASQFGREYIKLVNTQREEEVTARRLQNIREIENEDRIRRTEQLKREQAAQKAFAASVAAFGQDMANGLSQFGTAWNRLMALFNEGPSIIGDALRFIARFINENGQEIVATFNRIGEAFSSLFTSGQGEARDWSQTLMNTFRTIADLITNVLIPALQAVLGAANTIAAGLNQVFGTQITGPALILIGVVLQLTGGLRLLGTVITSLVLGVRLLTVALAALSLTPVGLAITAIIVAITAFAAALAIINWQAFVTGAQTAVTTVVGFFQNLPSTIGGLFNSLISQITGLWSQLVSGLNNIWQGFLSFIQSTLSQIAQLFSDAWTSLVQTVSNAVAQMGQAVLGLFPGLRTLIGLINQAVQAWNRLSAAEAQGSGTPGLARGGPIWGAGTSTSDSILARLSRGEYVIKAAAVRKYGSQLLGAINSMRLPKGRVPGFAAGGLVAGMGVGIPRFAAGGLALQPAAGATGRPIFLQLGQELFEFASSEETADRLGRYAVNRRLASAGRKPSSMGGN